MVNIAILKGIPKAWESATITMIPKKESNSNFLTDYRPISLLSCIDKLVERLTRNRLYFFLESNNKLIREQSGFRNRRGTSGNLLVVV